MIESHQYEFEGQPIKVTVSVGVGTMSDGMEADADLVKAADDAMYRAKRDGRNRVSG